MVFNKFVHGGLNKGLLDHMCERLVRCSPWKDQCLSFPDKLSLHALSLLEGGGRGSSLRALLN
jgi:hypothetical protein